MKKQLASATAIRDRNANSFNKGGTYEGYLPDGMSLYDKISLGALIGGTGNGAFGLAVDNLAGKNGRYLAEYGAQYFNRVSPGFARGVGIAGLGLSGIGIVMDAGSLIRASNANDEAATALAAFNVGADGLAIASGGTLAVAIGAVQIGLNVYAAHQDAIYQQGTIANAKTALATAAMAQTSINGIQQQMATIPGCK